MNKKLKCPYQLVADVLGISQTTLNENSAMGETQNWDSLNHISIIGELENHYGIQIPNEDIEKYNNMKEIINLHGSKN